jgi:cytochrome c-type biogenesis protein CcmH
VKYFHALMLVAALVWSVPVRAVQPDEMLADPKLEARARAISEELRCLVCQNESIDQSEAPLAHDLRVLVRQRIVAGDSDAQVMNFIVARYGEFVLLKPRLEWRTAALWGAPPGLLLIGIVMLIIAAMRRRGASLTAATANLTAAEEARVAALLRGEGAPKAEAVRSARAGKAR